MEPDVSARKRELRARLLAARRERSTELLERARAALRARILDRVRDAGWESVAAYVPLPTEPASTELLADLAGHGVRVLVPITLPDRDLDWATWSISGTGEALGLDAIASVQALFVPALAVARDGTRLGRGGGSYDRALTRTEAPAHALIFDDEYVPELPRAPWDRPVQGAAAPGGWLALPRPRRAPGIPGWP